MKESAFDVPTVSVVVACFNESRWLEDELGRVLLDGDENTEYIFVDDGSTDGSCRALNQYAEKDSRVKVICRSHEGLTQALIVGCQAARGRYIARFDCRDETELGRLRHLADLLDQSSNAVLAYSGVQFVGPGGEHLGELIVDGIEMARSLRARNGGELKGPWHGSVMFRRSAYEAVGGYRRQFRFAQDLDLFNRLAEIGEIVSTPRILYRAEVAPGTISGRFRKQQQELKSCVAACAEARRRGEGEERILERAMTVRRGGYSTCRRMYQARGFYFIGSCLRDQGNPTSVQYFRRAIKANPFHAKAWWRLFTSIWQSPRRPIGRVE